MMYTPDTVELERVDHSTDGSSLVAAETSSLITPMTKMFRSRAHSHSAVSEFRFISLTIIGKEEILFEKMATKFSVKLLVAEVFKLKWNAKVFAFKQSHDAL